MGSLKTELLNLNTFNCRGLGEGSKRRTIFNWIKKYHKGITFLQETHSTELSQNIWRNEWNGDIFFCHGSSTARGVAILIPCSIDIEVVEIIKDNTGRFLLLDTVFEGQTLILANIYAPTKNMIDLQIEFINFVHDRLVEYLDKHIIIGGDFNVCLNP